MKILFLSPWFPYPPNNGSKIRIYNLLRELSKRHEIDLLTFAEESEAGNEDQKALEAFCQHIEVIPKPIFRPSSVKALTGFLSTRPRSFIDTYSVEMRKLVEATARQKQFDVVVASELDAAPYAVTLSGITKVLDELQLTVLYEQFVNQRQPLRKIRSGLTWWKLSRYVTQLLNAYNGCAVASEQERYRVYQSTRTNCSIGVIPNGVDTNVSPNGSINPQPDTLVYAGALTFNANFDAMEFFLRAIFPKIQFERPGVKLYITGKVDGVPVERLPENRAVIFTGYLDDIHSKIKQSWASIVPLRIGGGTRLKILESLALGTPVVATSKGAEGLDLVPGRDLLIADEPTDFAAAVLRLLKDGTLRESLSQSGRQAVEEKYDWQIIGQQFNDFVETVVSEAK